MQRNDVDISRSEPHPTVALQRDNVDTARTEPSPAAAVAPQHDAHDSALDANAGT